MKTLVLLALVAGCYQRDLGTCAVTCATSSDCPDGLSCSAGRCGDSCGADTDGGTDADPDGPPVTGTIRVVVTDERGLPAGGVRVIATSAADGSPLADAATLGDGTLELPDITGAADVTAIVSNGSGSKLTTIRSVAPETTVTFGRRRNEAPSVNRTISWPSNANASQFFVYSSCNPTPKQHAATGGATQTTQLALDPTCADNFDIMVVFTDGAFQSFGLGSVANTGNVALTGSFVVFPQANVNFAELPADLSSVANTPLGGAVVFRDALPATGPSNFGVLAGGPDSATSVMSLPVTDVVARELYTLLRQSGDEFERNQQIAERLPPQGTYNLQVEPNLLPWIADDPVVDLAGRALTWTQISPGPDARTAADLVVAEINYTRGSLDFRWRIIAPPTAVTDTAGTLRLAVPDLPGDESFEPRATDALEGSQHLRLYGFTSTSGSAVSYAQVAPTADLAISTAPVEIFRVSDTFLTTGLGAVDLARMTVSFNVP